MAVGNTGVAVFAGTLTSWIRPPARSPEAMSQSVAGTTAKSSGLTTSQMNRISPTSSHAAAAGGATPRQIETTTDAASRNPSPFTSPSSDQSRNGADSLTCT